MTPTQAQTTFAATLARYGNTVTLPGGDTVKAILETNVERIRVREGFALESHEAAAVALLFFAADVPLAAGQYLTMAGERMAVLEVKEWRVGDVLIGLRALVSRRAV